MKAVIVDWLGRGGIAQTSEVWAMELGALAWPATIVTRPGREVSEHGYQVVTAGASPNPLRAHRLVVEAAVETIRSSSPDIVIVQNFIVPFLERRVYDQAHRAGARVVLVLHNSQPHSKASGLRTGLVGLVRRADDVVCHSRYVARAIPDGGEAAVHIVPLPPPVGLLRHLREDTPLVVPVGDRPLAVHFGVLRRRYKGTKTVVELSRAAPAWRFAAFGCGAPPPTPHLDSVPSFLPPGELARAVQTAAVAVLPYRRASQSAAVALAHAVGTVPVASAVGGIPEQIRDHVDGILVQSRAGVGEWLAALEEVGDETRRKAMATAGQDASEARHATFVAGIKKILQA